MQSKLLENLNNYISHVIRYFNKVRIIINLTNINKERVILKN